MHDMEVNIGVIDSFQFPLPSHFLDLGGDLTLQFTDGYWDSMRDRGMLTLNLWCGFPGSKIRGCLDHLMSAKVNKNDEPIGAIINDLKESEGFEKMVQSFFTHFSK